MDGEKRNYLAGTPSGALERRSATIALGPLEVLVRITHSGVCGTDAHDRTANCGLGHEGVGLVERIGSAVTAVEAGARQVLTTAQSCGHCAECIAGYRHYCHRSVGQKYGAEEHGTFCDYAVRHQDYVNPIPDTLESKHAAPLVCAGITVYEALLAANTQSRDRVGVFGLGGLGHLAVMYARAMGCAVSVFSGSADKKEDASQLGADEFHVVNKTSKPPAVNNVNVLLLCGGDITDIGLFLPLLARRARIVPVVIQTKPLTIPYMEFILPGHRLISSLGATRENEQEALRFAARHSLQPWIQEYPFTEAGLTSAFAALDDGAIRYRAVLSKELGNAFSV
ncbi:putative secondary metabolism biosynthetic enzyme [Sporothrix curviconia]|uniref:Secondary metabolism biosynthetic enzyme n=1 Tax=Sporothrix curviconia TaxID=1260050 RepID=A0ABP0C1Z9_9PEZI